MVAAVSPRRTPPTMAPRPGAWAPLSAAAQGLPVGQAAGGNVEMSNQRRVWPATVRLPSAFSNARSAWAVRPQELNHSPSGSAGRQEAPRETVLRQESPSRQASLTMWSSKRLPGPALIRRLCTLGLPIEGIAPALMRALCREANCDAGVVLWFDAHGEISNLYAHDLPSPQVLAGWFAAPTGTSAPPHLAARSISPVHRKKVVEICADGVPGERIERDKGPEPLCPHRRLCSMAVRPGHHCSVCAARSPRTALPSPRSLSIGHPQGALSAARSGSPSRRPVDTCR